MTGREAAILRHLVQGLANKEIAARVEISESTVKQAMHRSFAKTGVRTRTQLVKVALEDYRDLLSDRREHLTLGPREYVPTPQAAV